MRVANSRRRLVPPVMRTLPVARPIPGRVRGDAGHKPNTAAMSQAAPTHSMPIHGRSSAYGSVRRSNSRMATIGLTQPPRARCPHGRRLFARKITAQRQGFAESDADSGSPCRRTVDTGKISDIRAGDDELVRSGAGARDGARVEGGDLLPEASR